MKKTYAAVMASAFFVITPGIAWANFLAESHVKLDLRNFYMNSDFRNDGAAKSRAEEWAQGLWINAESGYTEGNVGFGVDLLGQLGIKLDSSAGRSGTGLLPVNSAGESDGDYSKLGVTGKMKMSKTVLKVGTLQPVLPVVGYNDTRLMPASYEGAWLTSQELKSLTVNAGRIDSQTIRNSSGSDSLNSNGALGDHLSFAGGTYELQGGLKTSYYWARLDDVYEQQYLGAVYDRAFSEATRINADLRVFSSQGEGKRNSINSARVDGGHLDNLFVNGMLSVYHKAHRFSIGYQNLSGDGDFPFVGQTPYSVNLVTVNTFTKAGTDAWQVRYDYDFAALGIPGLSLMTRYVDANHVRTSSVSNGRERERDTDLAYVVQSGAFKNVSIRWRNASFRSGSGLNTDIDENRLIIGYSIALW